VPTFELDADRCGCASSLTGGRCSAYFTSRRGKRSKFHTEPTTMKKDDALRAFQGGAACKPKTTRVPAVGGREGRIVRGNSRLSDGAPNRARKRCLKFASRPPCFFLLSSSNLPAPATHCALIISHYGTVSGPESPRLSRLPRITVRRHFTGQPLRCRMPFDPSPMLLLQ
jgi:hypothetical protein